jgi:hypothetical protein
MAHSDWEWTIHFQEKAPGLVRARLDALRLEAPFDKLFDEFAVRMPGEALLTGRGQEAHSFVIDAVKDLVYGWHVESGPPNA